MVDRRTVQMVGPDRMGDCAGSLCVCMCAERLWVMCVTMCEL